MSEVPIVKIRENKDANRRLPEVLFIVDLNNIGRCTSIRKKIWGGKGRGSPQPGLPVQWTLTKEVQVHRDSVHTIQNLSDEEDP